MPSQIWKQFSGQWTVTQAAQAKGAGTWPEFPGAPTIGTATGGPLNASVAFTAPANPGYPGTLSYTVTSSPGSITATGSASPIVVSGLTGGTSYTFTVTATNDSGTGPASAASNSVVPSSPSEAYSWGRDNNGAMGQNTLNINKSSPTQIGALTDWGPITSGATNAAASIKTDGSLWMWGRSNDGLLGQNNEGIDYSSPVQVGALTTWGGLVSIGQYCTFALKTDGTLWAWGDGGYGQLGQNSQTDYSSPVQVGAGTDWAYVAAGPKNVSAVKTDGTLWTWGDGRHGALGQNTGYAVHRSSPIQVGADTDWYKVGGPTSISTAFCTAIKTDGTLWAWGGNLTGNLGQNDTIARSSPVQIGSDTDWADYGQNGLHVMVIKTNGTLWAFGQGANGKLGTGNTSNVSSPVQIGALTNWLQTSLASAASFAVKTDGTLWSWGNPANGTLGNNTISPDINSPIQLGSLTTWSRVGAGVGQGYAIKDA